MSQRKIIDANIILSETKDQILELLNDTFCFMGGIQESFLDNLLTALPTFNSLQAYYSGFMLFSLPAIQSSLDQSIQDGQTISDVFIEMNNKFKVILGMNTSDNSLEDKYIEELVPSKNRQLVIYSKQVFTDCIIDLADLHAMTVPFCTYVTFLSTFIHKQKVRVDAHNFFQRFEQEFLVSTKADQQLLEPLTPIVFSYFEQTAKNKVVSKKKNQNNTNPLLQSKILETWVKQAYVPQDTASIIYMLKYLKHTANVELFTQLKPVFSNKLQNVMKSSDHRDSDRLVASIVLFFMAPANKAYAACVYEPHFAAAHL